MKIKASRLEGVLIIEPRVFSDARGAFMEIWNQNRYAEIGLDTVFVQDNMSRSNQGVLRGLHFQNPVPQGKLVQVLAGEIYDVAVDIRSDSKHFGEWIGVTLSEWNNRQLYIPEGYAHGFCVVSKNAMVVYKCTDFYNASTEKCLRWDDPDLAIEWPISEPTLSQKDCCGQQLKDFEPRVLPTIAG